MVEKDLKHLFITSSSSHFFKKPISSCISWNSFHSFLLCKNFSIPVGVVYELIAVENAEYAEKP